MIWNAQLRLSCTLLRTSEAKKAMNEFKAAVSLMEQSIGSRHSMVAEAKQIIDDFHASSDPNELFPMFESIIHNSFDVSWRDNRFFSRIMSIFDF
jgi:hypothetical protein